MSSRLLLSASLVLAFSLATAFAEEKSTDPVFTDPDAAGPDFAIQGEYTGEKCGAQVIALGDGKFHIVGWSKGLPGAVEDAEKKVEVDAQRDGDKVLFDGGGWKGKIESGQLVGTSDEGRTMELRRIVRESPIQKWQATTRARCDIAHGGVIYRDRAVGAATGQ